MGTNLTLPRSSSGSYLRATRLSAGVVGAKKRQGDIRATNLLRQLRHPVPPPPQEISSPRNMCVAGMHDSNVSGTVTVLDPTPFPPLSYVLGEIKFVGKTLSRSECRIETPLAAAALTPGLLKHGKEVDIYHFHVSLAHVHASVLKATAKQHVIRLNGEWFHVRLVLGRRKIAHPLHIITRRGERRNRWDLSTSTPLDLTQFISGGRGTS